MRNKSSNKPQEATRVGVINSPVAGDAFWSRTAQFCRSLSLILPVLYALGSGQLAAQPKSETDRVSTVPINFYGRVVDQDGNPLPSVRVESDIVWWTNRVTGESDLFHRTTTNTDPEGNFQFRDVEGAGIWIRALTKQGFEPEGESLRTFKYNATSIRKPDDPAKPLVFRMWKEGTNQKYAYGGTTSGLPLDGSRHPIGLNSWPGTSRYATTTNFTIRFKRPVDARSEDKFDWSFILEAHDGGILEEQDEFSTMCLAPTEGYLPQYEFRMESGNPKWSKYVTKRFYFRNQAGTAFGRATLTILQFQPHVISTATLQCNYEINTVGGRVLRAP
jgi:hypothetical protein